MRQRLIIRLQKAFTIINYASVYTIKCIKTDKCSIACAENRGMAQTRPGGGTRRWRQTWEESEGGGGGGVNSDPCGFYLSEDIIKPRRSAWYRSWKLRSQKRGE